MTERDVAEIFDGGDAPILVFADHASNAIPEPYDNLGLSPDALQTHIGWDVGAEALARKLADTLQTKLLLCRFSRLLIDTNRSLDMVDVIPLKSDGIEIPGNASLAAAERERRIACFYQPYHHRLDRAVSQLAAGHTDPLVISVHSFTPRLTEDAEARPWHVGLLWREDETSARSLMKTLREEAGYVVGDNQPYDARIYNYSMDKHVSPRGLRHVTLEVRQDLISNEVGVDDVAGKLSAALQKL